MVPEPIIETADLKHVYESGVVALDGVSVSVTKGDSVALIGQNGSGKTTLAKHLIGLLRPTSGAVKINGEDIVDKSVAQISREVGFVFQNPDHQIFCSSVRDELEFGLKIQGLKSAERNERIDDIACRFGLEDHIDHPPAILGFGLRRKVSLASICAMRPNVLILDEPTVGLDRRSSVELMNTVMELNAEGHTVLIITHDMRVVAEYTKSSLILKGGKLLAAGPTSDLLTRFDLLAETQIAPPQVIELTSTLGMRKQDDGLPMNNEEFLRLYGEKNAS
jgi:energy-coupling factor transporter ATP-binding protein EcfA2